MIRTGPPARRETDERKSPRGRRRREATRQRKQLIVDTTLLEKAMMITGRNQSDTVNEALAQLTENAMILEGLLRVRGAFPDHPDHHDGR